ncbi:unnamed protein product [Sphagnum compactum]
MNKSTQSLTDWKLSWKAQDSITQCWAAKQTFNSDGSLSFSSLDYNKSIPAGGSIEFGYTAYSKNSTPSHRDAISFVSSDTPSPSNTPPANTYPGNTPPVIPSSSGPFSTTPVATPARRLATGEKIVFRVQGNRIVDDQGNDILFKGLDRPSLEWNPQGTQLSEEEIATMKEKWKANVVRISLNQNYWFCSQEVSSKGSYKQIINAIVASCIKNEMAVILDLHWTENGHQNPMANRESLRFWREVAIAYKDFGTVIFEPFNEPYDISQEVWLHGDTEYAGYQELVDEIRKTEPIFKVAEADEEQEADGTQRRSVLNALGLSKSTDATQLFASLVDVENRFLGITGGTGFIGQTLQQAALEQKKNILLFSRHSQSLPGARSWSQTSIPDLSGCNQLVHLAGESILGLWTREKRRRILESRREGTRRLVEGIAQAAVKPSVLVSASAIGYYGDHRDALLDETAPGGSGFLAEIAQVWEEEALKAKAYGVRVVLVRIGIVLGATGGIMKLITPLFRLGLGGILGSGKQWMSCIHVKDLARLMLKCADDPNIRGPVNAVMPHPLTNATFTKTVGALLQRPTFLRTPAVALRLGLGELSTLLLGSQRILPTKALEHGYDFQYPTVESALREVFKSTAPIEPSS